MSSVLQFLVGLIIGLLLASGEVKAAALFAVSYLFAVLLIAVFGWWLPLLLKIDGYTDE